MAEKISGMRILGLDVTVEADAELGRGRNLYGEWHPGLATVTIDPSLPPQQQGETLVHETLEALKSLMELELEHPTLSALSAGLHAVLRANPELVKAICEGKEIVHG